MRSVDEIADNMENANHESWSKSDFYLAYCILKLADVIERKFGDGIGLQKLKCPACGSESISTYRDSSPKPYLFGYKCDDCGISCQNRALKDV